MAPPMQNSVSNVSLKNGLGVEEQYLSSNLQSNPTHSYPFRKVQLHYLTGRNRFKSRHHLLASFKEGQYDSMQTI
jgi:hypothetical protein